MRPPLKFFVAGLCQTAGSKRAFYIENLKRAVVTDDNPKSKGWKECVRLEALRHVKGPLWDCPIALRLTFTRLRPKFHLRTNGAVKDGAPMRPTTKPDALKLARGVEDALTGIVWTDDSLIVDEALHKVYGLRPGVTVEIFEAQRDAGHKHFTDDLPLFPAQQTTK